SQSAAASTHAVTSKSTKVGNGRVEFHKAATATPFRKHGSAYELALVSPSERTHATQAMTPGGEENDVDVSELDIPFDEQMEDKVDQSPWDEEGHNDDDDVEHADDQLQEWTSRNINKDTPGMPTMENGSEGIAEEEEEDDKCDSPRTVEMDMTHQVYSLTAATPVVKKKKLGLFSSLKKKKRPDPPTGDVIVEDDEPVESTPLPVTQNASSSTPLLAPPKGVPVTFDSVAPSSSSASQQRAVTPQTLSSFNKMKQQAQQAEKMEKQKRHQDKIKDRRLDIQDYNDLWEEYSSIQEKIITEQDAGSVVSAAPSTCEKVSIADTTTWFVDFSSMSVNGQLIGSDDDEDDGDDDDDVKSTSSYSLHSEMSENAQKDYFKQKAKKRRMSLGRSDSMGNLNSSVCDDDKRSIVMGDNHSVVSDVSSENGSAVERNDDYGVLHRFRHKSIEQSVMDYAEYFAETPGQATVDTECPSVYSSVRHVVSEEVRDEVQGYSDVYSEAPTPKTVNSRAVSIGSYLEEMALPSVSIENAETGVVRWRQFPKSEERAKTARKLDFQDDEARDDSNPDIDLTTEGLLVPELTVTARDVAKPQEMKERPKPKIKTYDPVISSLSTDDFYRVSSSKNGIRHIKSKSDVPKVSKIDMAGRATSVVAADDTNLSSTEELKERQDLLARKVGTKLESLIAQLKENGLGEK
ncbi:MAG: hypothetical protein SGILL_001744, partial [Bacillariaceae sp.]